ncbi:MAG: hypothetical protein RID53_00400 [Coleofasciculus sp. B1-GNL1-01]|uniref:hypothetical protein n=1 Tax=Coleofasciculus sp. B1-GNL1-01 TaxID=3068484 RepID=UPI0032F77363
MLNDKDRYLIVGTGRSGSSLLAAILADAGADFNLPSVLTWNRSSGAYEHPKLICACKWFFRSHKAAFLSDQLRRFCEIRMERELLLLWQEAVFAKYPNAVWLIHFIPRLGYSPKVILSYREFTSFSLSEYLKKGVSMPDLVKKYYEINSTAMLALNVFGGVAVSYEELVDKNDTMWADAISSLTNIDSQKIIYFRNQRVKEIKNKNNFSIYYDEKTTNIYQSMVELKGKLIKNN